ncbi:hypothetical protein X797_007659 [Metarhizium robertsii]|uniref:Uncharacterized protein n=1 Tax=Metarhizium robertsii TaxID=568076 RepID=A0A014P7Q3_9HYPO|nr:hypothetical protein X797_007659 [Metarhizium robertsii]
MEYWNPGIRHPNCYLYYLPHPEPRLPTPGTCGLELLDLNSVTFRVARLHKGYGHET